MVCAADFHRLLVRRSRGFAGERAGFPPPAKAGRSHMGQTVTVWWRRREYDVETRAWACDHHGVEQEKPIRDAKFWKAVRKDYESGMPGREVASKWGLTKGNLGFRASKEKWSTPARLRKMARELATSQARAAHAHMTKLAASMDVRLPPVVAAEYQQAVAAYAAEHARRGLKSLPKPKNWRELAIVDTLARRALGLDKAQQTPATLIRVGAGAGPVDVGIVDIGTESVPESVPTDDDWPMHEES